VTTVQPCNEVSIFPRRAIVTFALSTEGLPMSSTTLPGRTTNLPVPLTSLIGREREVATLVDLLHRDDIRLFTLTGSGGVGKTRLALRVAQEASRDFPDGIWFVPLASVRDPALVLSAIAQALDVCEAGHRSLLEGIAHVLHGKDALLFLDNFEHVVESAPHVSELLSRCPRLTCVVTSRALLRISGEHAFPVPPLPLPPTAYATTAERARLSPAVRLFVSRAQAARPDFDLTDGNAGEVEAICRRLDGLPLAIELAAARVRHLAPAELAARLREGNGGAALRMLTGGPRDAPGRQQTLRYAVAWSHDLLAPQEQALFRRLAVFVGGFTLEAAEAVVNSAGDAPIDVVEGIAALVDQSLLQQAEGIRGASRYDMLETVREFALEQLLTSGEEAAVRDAHAAYFLALAEWAAPLLSSEHQQTWLERLQAEQANLRIVLARSEQEDDVDRALRLAAALWRFWHRRGYWEEGRGWLARLLMQAKTVDAVGPTTWAAALTGAGWLAHYQNDFAAAETSLQEAVEGYRRLGRTDGLVAVRHCQALVAQSLGEHRRAADLCEEALSLSRTIGDPDVIAESLCNLSRAVRELGDYARATSLAQEALDLHRAARHRGKAHALLVFGDVARDLGEAADVRIRCEESLAIFRELGEPLGEGFSLHNLGVAAYREGDLDLARTLCEQSLSVFRRGDVRGAMAEVLASLGSILHTAGYPASALAVLTEALQLAAQVGPRWVVAATLEGIAKVAAGRRQDRVAIELISGAAALRTAIEVPVPPNWRIDLERTLAATRATLSQGDFAVAWKHGHVQPLSDLITAATNGSLLAQDDAIAESSVVLAEAATSWTPVAEGQSTPRGLTSRELEVLQLLTVGHSNRQVGEKLFISPTTAARHIANIYNKLGVDSRAEATAFAYQHGLA
jgi:predicted ATPase/DNA-binding NarL/FixJ family response regulator